MPASGPRPEPTPPPPPAPDPGGLPFQWSLLAWAALVGLLTGLAVVAFHELVGLINSALFGPLVEALLSIGPAQPPPAPPELPPPTESTPLAALLQIGLGGLGYLPTPPSPPEPPTALLPPLPSPAGCSSGRWCWCPAWVGWRWACCAAGPPIPAPGFPA